MQNTAKYALGAAIVLLIIIAAYTVHKKRTALQKWWGPFEGWPTMKGGALNSVTKTAVNDTFEKAMAWARARDPGTFTVLYPDATQGNFYISTGKPTSAVTSPGWQYVYYGAASPQ
jgi:hypothetical protein